ncbi:MAG: hypothetical protein E6I65_03690 [Chloroflexi bacterium]|nr:MAG: hypothetical protein E6I65_03690 [Chloroflexota bacterium]
MVNAAGPGRFIGVAFVAIVAVAIVALLAGYGIPVGVGALAGFILGALAGLLGSLWLIRGMGRSLTFGGMSWSSSDEQGQLAPQEMTDMREMSELLQVDLGPIRSIVPVLETSNAGGYEVQLVTAEMREGGLLMILEVRSKPGSLPAGFWADVTVHDDAGSTYRASGQNIGSGPSPTRYLVTIAPTPPAAARRLEVVVERFMDPFPGGGRIAMGPWAFTVELPARDIAAR